MRDLVAETRVDVQDLVAPLFVREAVADPIPITSLPGVVQHTVDSLRREVNELAEL
ncbi:MAG: porphobilinogen synthase, partial [Ilumatobacteraceae bacterium]